ncbi:hypothetical protein [Duncaniella muris]|uniref:hypothetical protein n=1 Tax=Duncaniella muris TaxID=2094150 RepID=UPI0025A5FF93|nr:hypothetical protein [Duncaniella muris]
MAGKHQKMYFSFFKIALFVLPIIPEIVLLLILSMLVDTDGDFLACASAIAGTERANEAVRMYRIGLNIRKIFCG